VADVVVKVGVEATGVAGVLVDVAKVVLVRRRVRTPVVPIDVVVLDVSATTSST